MSAVWTPSSMVVSQALCTAAAAAPWPKCASIFAALSSRPLGLARSCPAMSGAEPWIASNMAKSSPMFADGASPTEPLISAAMSDRMSPYRLGVTITSKRSGALASRPIPMSTIIESDLISGYSAATSSKTRRKSPSVSFMMLSFVKHVTLRRPRRFAYSKA